MRLPTIAWDTTRAELAAAREEAQTGRDALTGEATVWREDAMWDKK